MTRHFLAKSALIITASEIIFNLSAFVIHAVVGRILGPEDYGRYGLVVTLTTMVIVLVGNGIPTAMAKYLSEFFETSPAKVRAIKRQAVILQSAIIGTLTLLFFLSAPLIARLLGDPTLTNLFRISSLIIPAFAAASFYFSYYTGLHKFNIQAFLKIARSAFRIIFIIGLAYFFRVEGSIVGYILAPFCVFLIAYFIDKFKITRELRADESKSERISSYSKAVSFDWRVLVNYAWQIVIFFLAYELMISVDLYLVKRILGSNYLTGIYNASLTAGRIPYYLFYALTIVLLPAISRATSQNNLAEAGRIISQSLRVMLILLVPLIIIMVNFSRPIIKIFYSQKYIEAAAPMAILLWGVGFLTIFYVMSFVMNGAGKTKIPMFLAIGGAFLNAGLNIILIKKYALIGSALATSLTSFAAMVFMIYFVYRHFGKLAETKELAKIFLAGTGAYFFARLFPAGDYAFIFYSLVIFGFYILVLYLLDEIKKSDIYFIKGLLARKKSEKNSPS
jgi:stage V sporulation protein B